MSQGLAVRYHWRWAALATLLVAEAMNLLDATIVQVAAPVIHAQFGGPDSDIQWYGAAYTLPFAVLLIAGGRLGDILGRKRMFRLGVAGFMLASLVCAFADAAGMLITARSVQGAAAAVIIPQTIGLIRGMFAGDELAKAFGAIGPVMALSAVCGPLLGGVLTHADLFGSSWRAVFLVNVPLGIAVLLAAPLLREDRAAHRPRLDLVGTALAVLGTGLVVYPLIEAWSWPSLIAGVLVLVLFGLHQRRNARRGRSPLIEPSLFVNRGFPAALASSLLFFATTTGLMLVVVLRLQLSLHADVLTAGLSMLPWSGGLAVSSLVGGQYLVPRFGSKVMFAGLATLLVGTLAVSASWPLLPALAVCGLGQGLFTVPFFSTAIGRVHPHETGSAAGLINAVQQLGGTLGIALLGTAFLHSDLQSACWIAAGLVVATGVATAVMATPQG